MKALRPLPLALGLALALSGASTLAQTTSAKPAAKPVAKAAVGKAAAKPAAKPVADVAPPAANDEQKAAASIAHVGDYACEFEQTVVVGAHPTYEGYLDMKHKSQSWVMKPVLSSTGALRLEDVKGRMLMIQIANKSMVMDTQIGQRLVDGCMHEKQREFARNMASQPAAGSLLK